MKKQTQSAWLHIPITYLGHAWKGEVSKLPANKVYTLVIDYPFGGAKKHLFPIKTGKNGLGLIGLLSKIGRAYEKIYKKPDAYGVFGHDIDDLSLSSLSVNHKTKKIRLGVDS